MAGRSRSKDHPTLPFEEATCSVSELCAEVRALLRAAPARWVAGEVQRCRRSRAGHLYLELVEKGSDDEVVGKLESVVWRRDLTGIERRLEETGESIRDGLEIRCRGEIDFYAPFGRLQLVVREVDPVFLIGQLSQRRRETMQALAAAGLLDRNRGLQFTPLPLDVALVTSEGSAAYHDFLSTLAESGYGFKIVHVHAAVQGREAEHQLASALAAAGALPVEVTVLVRGGGSRTDLAAFDSRRVAEAVARSRIPVITGLGHQIDLSIADQVAHTATRTPTQAAEFLVRRVQEADERTKELAGAIQRHCSVQLETARNRMAGVESGLRLATYRLQSGRERLRQLSELLGRSARLRLRLARRALAEWWGRLVISAPRELGRRSIDLGRSFERAVGVARARLREATLEVEGLERVCSHLAPERTVARGFSITRDSRGRVVVTPSQVTEGERIVTQLAQGELTSRVEE